MICLIHIAGSPHKITLVDDMNGMKKGGGGGSSDPKPKPEKAKRRYLGPYNGNLHTWAWWQADMLFAREHFDPSILTNLLQNASYWTHVGLVEKNPPPIKDVEHPFLVIDAMVKLYQADENGNEDKSLPPYFDGGVRRHEDWEEWNKNYRRVAGGYTPTSLYNLVYSNGKNVPYSEKDRIVKKTRDEAVKWAAAQIGDPYSVFVSKTNTDKFYCSQLVWASYHYGAKNVPDLQSQNNSGINIDLDMNGGFWVMPGDLITAPIESRIKSANNKFTYKPRTIFWKSSYQ